MAIFHLNAKVISRGKGQSAIAAAAYRSGEMLLDEQAGEVKHYRARAERIQFTEIMVPAAAPRWANDRNSLWNAAEQAERRKDAQLAREIEVALPHELTDEQRAWLVKDFAREAFVRRGYGADIAIHAPEDGHDGRNHHAHIMVTRRTLGPEGFAPTKDWQLDKAFLAGLRQQWEHLANRHLERHGHAARIDHRSLEAQGVDREPGVHLGYAADGMERRGEASDRGDELRGVVGRNGIRAEMGEIDKELKGLEATEAKARAEAVVALQKDSKADDRAATVPVVKESEPNKGTQQGALSASIERKEGHAAAERGKVREEPRKAASRQPKPAEKGLKVVDGAMGLVGGLADFVCDFLAASGSSTPAGKPDAQYADPTDPAARRARQRARIAAADAAERDRKALERIDEDMKAGRNLSASDIRSLTRAHQEQIRDHGDDAMRQMVDEARRSSERFWKGEERERE